MPINMCNVSRTTRKRETTSPFIDVEHYLHYIQAFIAKCRLNKVIVRDIMFLGETAQIYVNVNRPHWVSLSGPDL